MDATANQRVALWVTAAGSFFTPFMSSAVNIALPAIGREFGLDAVSLGWVATSFLLAAAVFLVPFGKLADMRGRKRIFMLGLALYAFAALLSGLAPSGTWLIVFRALHGLGGAMMFGTAVAILSSVFPPGGRGRALGIAVSATYLGLSLGPVLGGFLTQHLGWRSIFLIFVPLSAGVLLLTWLRLKGEWAEARDERFDWTGSLLYGLSLAALIYGFSRLPGILGAGLAGAALLGLGLFARWELGRKNPVLDMRLFLRNRVFAFSTLAALINYSATFAVTFLLSLYLQYLRACTPQQAGLILIAQPVMMAAFSPLAGRLSDRIDPGIVASAGMALTAVGLLLLAFLSRQTSLLYIIVSQVVIGFGFALFSSPNTNAVMNSVAKGEYGIASATLGTMRLTGQMLSMGITMLILALHVGSVRISPEAHSSFLAGNRSAFLIFALLCTAGVFASLARGRSGADLQEHG